MTAVKPPTTAKILQFPKVGDVAKPAAQGNAKQANTGTVDVMGPSGQASPIAAPQGGHNSALLARLMAMSPAKTRISRTEKGNVLSGSIEASNKTGLAALADVDAVDGDVAVSEGAFRLIDLTALGRVRDIAGRFTFEGNRSA
jgi:hypothetical protein